VESHNLTYTVLSDSTTEAAQAFGLAFQVDAETFKKFKGYGIDLEDASGEDHHILPVPAVFLVGTDGVILFDYINPDYRVRIDPETLLEAARDNAG
jgi:peroxiredoxin